MKERGIINKTLIFENCYSVWPIPLTIHVILQKLPLREIEWVTDE